METAEPGMAAISTAAGCTIMAASSPSNAPRSSIKDLAAAALLGRCAEHGDREPEVVGEPGQSEPGADRGGGDDVVPAGVADPGQRVVLRADRDVQRPRAHAWRVPRWAARSSRVRRRTRPRSAPRRPRHWPGPPRTPAPGGRGSGATAPTRPASAARIRRSITLLGSLGAALTRRSARRGGRRPGGWRRHRPRSIPWRPCPLSPAGSYRRSGPPPCHWLIQTTPAGIRAAAAMWSGSSV